MTEQVRSDLPMWHSWQHSATRATCNASALFCKSHVPLTNIQSLTPRMHFLFSFLYLGPHLGSSAVWSLSFWMLQWAGSGHFSVVAIWKKKLAATYSVNIATLFQIILTVKSGEKKWVRYSARQSTPVLLPRKFHGWRSLVGYSPWGHKESDTTEQLHEGSQPLKGSLARSWMSPSGCWWLNADSCHAVVRMEEYWPWIIPEGSCWWAVHA